MSRAVLTLVDDTGRQADRGVTDADGRYGLTAAHAGRFLLLTVVPGHRPVAAHVVLRDDTLVHHDLVAGAVSLSPV